MDVGLTPILDYILVRKTEEPLAGGLYLAAPADPTAPRYAEVVAVGGGRPSEYSGAMIFYNGEASPVKAGDTILMHGGAGTKVKRGTDEYWAILPRDVIGIVAPSLDFTAPGVLDVGTMKALA